MKLAINIPGMGEVFTSTNADVINRAALARKRGLIRCRYAAMKSYTDLSEH